MGTPTSTPESPEMVRKGPVPAWFRLLPFFSSAVLFFSGLFALLAPLPLLVFGVRASRVWAWAAITLNSFALWILAGPISGSSFLILVGTPALLIPELLRRRRALNSIIGWTLVGMLATAGAIVSIYATLKNVDVLSVGREQFSQVLKGILESMGPEAAAQWFGTAENADFDEIRRAVLTELPSALLIVALVFVWSNLSMLLRLNPLHVRERSGFDAGFFRAWKAPEILVWPAIASGAALLFASGSAAIVALNTFKVLMAVYALQGLSILSWFFDAWSLRGGFRSLAYAIALFVMLPLLLGLGFFDLWFDFRSKLRQS